MLNASREIVSYLGPGTATQSAATAAGWGWVLGLSSAVQNPLRGKVGLLPKGQLGRRPSFISTPFTFTPSFIDTRTSRARHGAPKALHDSRIGLLLSFPWIPKSSKMRGI